MKHKAPDGILLLLAIGATYIDTWPVRVQTDHIGVSRREYSPAVSLPMIAQTEIAMPDHKIPRDNCCRHEPELQT